LFARKNHFEQAKTEFQNAATLKSNEEYPKTKIAEIDKLLGDMKAMEERYNASISKGDQLLKDKIL